MPIDWLENGVFREVRVDGDACNNGNGVFLRGTCLDVMNRSIIGARVQLREV
jgi:hypothetical protein